MITFSSLPSSESVQSRLDSEKAAVTLHSGALRYSLHTGRGEGGKKGNGPRAF